MRDVTSLTSYQEQGETAMVVLAVVPPMVTATAVLRDTKLTLLLS